MNDLNFSPVTNNDNYNISKTMVCKSNADGIIEYVNEDLVVFTGYEPYEIIGKNRIELRHPDMPQSIYNLLEERLLAKQNFQLLLKDRTKHGKEYWYVSNFEIKLNQEGKVESIVNHRELAPSIVTNQMDTLYTKLLRIEQNTNMDVAKKYFHGFLEEQGLSFTNYTQKLLMVSIENSKQPSKNSSFWKRQQG
jgi:PAS domain S-box-containing protein